MSAKSIHAPDSYGEIARRIGARRSRYELAGQAQRVLFDPELPAELQHRTVWCHRAIKNTESGAGIRRRLDGSSARLTGVVTCGSVWTCPVCSARVAERRRVELERAVVAHNAAGGHAYLMTLTFPHERDLPLADARKLFAKALQRFKNSRAFKSAGRAYQRAGSVRSLEITWGPEHGWHVHTHDLIFAAPGLDTDAQAIDQLRGAWIKALLGVGLGDSSRVSWMWQYALDIRGGQAAAEYVTKFGHDAKWGITAEVTRSHAKVGMRQITAHEGHVTPFQMLAWAGAGDFEAVRLFREFAEQFKSARMLYWSPGLKAKMGLDDADDAEIAGDDSPRPEEKEVANLTAEQLALVISRGALGELIERVCYTQAADREDYQACVDDFIAEFRERPRTGRGTVRQRSWKSTTFYEVRPAA